MPIAKLRSLRRNPQYLSERQSEALRRSIDRDGFLAPIVIRKSPDDPDYFEILSGNHRVLACGELQRENVAAVLVHDCSDEQARRIAVNMNTVHGDPTPELLAPFLADLSMNELPEIFLGDGLRKDLLDFDAELEMKLRELALPDSLSKRTSIGSIPNCVCKCGHRHVAIAPVKRKSGHSKRPTTKR